MCRLRHIFMYVYTVCAHIAHVSNDLRCNNTGECASLEGVVVLFKSEGEGDPLRCEY